MRTPKFNQADVDYILQLLSTKKVAEVAEIIGCSYLTAYRIKKGTYKVRQSEVSGLTHDRPGLVETLRVAPN